MGLAVLILGLLVLLGAHVLVSRRKARATVIANLGLVPYKLVFSLISAVGIILIAWGFGHYRSTEWVDVWSPPAWTRVITDALMWPSTVCVVAAYSPGHIKRALGHPMLVGVKLWAVAHLVSDGDLGSIILFGSVLAWAGYDRLSLSYRTDRGAPSIPVGGRRNDIIAVVVGTIVYLALGLTFHPIVVGVPVFGS